MKDFLKKNWFNICILFIYSLITLILVMFHENWRDEAQSWLIARDLNFIDIFKQMKYEGHPCLWHYIVAPFAKLGFPYIMQNIIAWAIMCITSALVLWKSNISKFLKVLIVFSAPFIYFYSAIARSYALIPLALALIAITYKNRKEKPIHYVLSITFLAHTHVLMLGLVGALFVFFFFEELILKFKNKTGKEKKLLLISLIVAIVGLLVLVLELYSSIGTNPAADGKIAINENMFKFCGKIIYKITENISGNDSKIVNWAIIIGFICVAIYGLIRNTKNTVILIISIAFQICIYLFVYADLDYQKVFTTLLVLMFYLWIGKYEERKKVTIAIETYLVFVLVFNCVLGIKSGIEEIKNEYSNAKLCADYIESNISKDSVFITSNIPFSTAIIPYTDGYKFWSPQTCDYFTFATWNEETNSSYTLGEFFSRIEETFKETDNIYFLYCNNWNDEAIAKFKEVTSAEEIYTIENKPIKQEETYTIYKFNNKKQVK